VIEPSYSVRVTPRVSWSQLSSRPWQAFKLEDALRKPLAMREGSVSLVEAVTRLVERSGHPAVLTRP
jgi:hypothetical protein